MWIIAVSFVLLFLPELSSAQEKSMEGDERLVSTPQQTGIDSKNVCFSPLGNPPQSTLSIVLPCVSEAEKSALEENKRNRSGPLQIGFGRAVPTEYRGDLAARLEWSSGSETDADGGPVVAALTVTSPGAAALRVGLRAKLAAGATLRFSSLSDPEQQFRPFTHEDFGSSADVVWSPVIEGDTVRVDINLPSSEALPTFSLFLDRVSHIVAPVARSDSQ